METLLDFLCFVVSLPSPPSGMISSVLSGTEPFEQARRQAGRKAGRQAGRQARRHAGRQAIRQARRHAGSR